MEHKGKHPDDDSFDAPDQLLDTGYRRRYSDFNKVDAACSRGTCVYHEQNMDVFKDFKDTLHEISKALQILDKEMANQSGGNRVWVIILGITVTLVIAVSSFFISDYTRYKETCKADLAVLSEKLETGMKIRIRLEETVSNMRGDVQELQKELFKRKND